MNFTTRSGDGLVRNRRARNACAGLLALSLGCGLASVILFGGCNSSPSADQVAAWKDAAQRQEERVWHEVHEGYNGGFACHTADGGCLQMTCSTANSCDYMQKLMARCAAPLAQDPKVLNKIVVAGYACTSVEKSKYPDQDYQAHVSGFSQPLSGGNNQ